MKKLMIFLMICFLFTASIGYSETPGVNNGYTTWANIASYVVGDSWASFWMGGYPTEPFVLDLTTNHAKYQLAAILMAKTNGKQVRYWIVGTGAFGYSKIATVNVED